MKKILFLLVALTCSMNMSAQFMKIMKDGQFVAAYKVGQADRVVMEEEEVQELTPIGKQFESWFIYNEKAYYFSKSCTITEADNDDGVNYWNGFLSDPVSAWEDENFTPKWGLPCYYDAEKKEMRIGAHYNVGTYTKDGVEYKVMLYDLINEGDYITFDVVDNDGAMRFVEKIQGQYQFVVYKDNSLKGYFPAEVSATYFDEITSANAPRKARSIMDQVKWSEPIMFATPIPFDSSKVKTLKANHVAKSAAPSIHAGQSLNLNK